MRKLCIGMVMVIVLMSIGACSTREEMGKLILGKENLMLEKVAETAKNSETSSKENDGEEYERIFISDTNFIEVLYGKMDLPESVLVDKEDDDYYVELQIEKIIPDKETAGKIAMVVLETYYRDNQEDLTLDVQYIPSRGYYYIMLGEYGTMQGHRIEFILDEKDGRVVKMWDRDNKWAFFRE